MYYMSRRARSFMQRMNVVVGSIGERLEAPPTTGLKMSWYRGGSLC